MINKRKDFKGWHGFNNDWLYLNSNDDFIINACIVTENPSPNKYSVTWIIYNKSSNQESVGSVEHSSLQWLKTFIENIWNNHK